jgi:hypothetical protein
VVLHQLLLEVVVAAKVREEQLVLRVQRRALAKDAKVEVVGRLDEASAAAPASGHRDEDMGRRYGFIQLDDRKHLRALRDVDRGRQARHKWDLEAAHRLVFVFSDVPGHLDLLHWVDARRPRHVRMLPFSRLVILLSPSKSP